MEGKAAGFVSYRVQAARAQSSSYAWCWPRYKSRTVRNQVLLSMFTDFENFSVFKPASNHEKSVHAMLDRVIAWGGALKSLREK